MQLDKINDIKSEINELIQEKDISDNQKKTLNHIKNNLNNKDELKKIINDLKNKNSVIIGTYRADGKFLPFIYSTSYLSCIISFFILLRI